jgi:PAS domain S-box-containing protein
LPEFRTSRVALVGPAARALGPQLAAAGFDLAEGGAAVIDLPAAASQLVEIRRRYAPVVGVVADQASPGPDAEALDGLVRLPDGVADLPPLLRTLIRAAHDRDDLQRQADDLSALIDLTATLAAGGDPERALSRVVDRIAERLPVERCSLVMIEADGGGTVVASTDEAPARGTRIDLANHREFREVMLTGRPLVIHDAQAQPRLDPLREPFLMRQIGALAVAPMTCEGAVAGMVFARCRTRGGLTSREVGFLCAVGSIGAVALRNAGRIQSERRQRVAAEREVSQLRRYEVGELRKSKEFLERLIDATSDGIVAADLSGTILLFNKGAERMTGFSAAALVGKRSVRELYPRGLAENVMQRLRASRAAGEEFGRMRCELVAKSGEAIPVDLSAAIVADEGRDTASVGVFHDRREELRREAELRSTRERLEEAEKAAVISELAGAAAHELNQPLTSVVGFSELLLRRTQENENGREELAAILREAERMASIVKKIGRITRYETTAYVGKTRIVDLDRASNPPPHISVMPDKP